MRWRAGPTPTAPPVTIAGFVESGGFRDHLRLNTGFLWTDHLAGQVDRLAQMITDTLP